MRASDLMTQSVISLDEDSTVGDAVEAVSVHEVRHLPIVRDGRVIGMISDRDLRPVFGMMARTIPPPGGPDGGPDASAGAPAFDNPLAASITSLVSGTVVSVLPSAGADEVIDRFLETLVGAVAVTEADGTLLGIISYLDLLRAARGRL